MHTTATRLIARNSIFAWVAAASCTLLLIPISAMQFTAAVNWGIGDFVVMGILLFATGSVFVLAARRIRPKRWWVVGVLLGAVFLYVWAELAVGVFTNLGS